MKYLLNFILGKNKKQKIEPIVLPLGSAIIAGNLLQDVITHPGMLDGITIN